MKTFLKSALRDVSKNISRFITIIAIVTLGCGFLIGLQSSTPVLKKSVGNYYFKNIVSDLIIKSQIGFNDKSLENIKAYDGVLDAKMYYERDDYAYIDDLKINSRMIIDDLSYDINKLKIEEGRMPSNNKECVISNIGNYEIGQEIDFDGSNYKIVGIVSSPLYYTKQNEISTNNSSFNLIIYTDIKFVEIPVYTDIAIKLDIKEKYFTDEYIDCVDVYAKNLDSSNFNDERKNEVLASIKEEIYNNVKNEIINEMIDKGISSELAEGQASLMMDTEEYQSIVNDLYEENKDIDCSLYYLSLDKNKSYSMFSIFSNKVDDIAVIFPIFFYLIAGLISLTTLTRLVKEERSSIGTLKSLGYSKSSIILKYVSYAVIFSLIGGIFAIATGIFILPYVIYGGYKVLFYLPKIVFIFDPIMIFIYIVLMIVLIAFITFITVFKEVKLKPSELLVPAMPKEGAKILLERIPFLWRRLKFKYKSTLRNIFRFKKNLIMMIVGIGGCVGLLIVALGISDAIAGLSKTQYDKLFTYDVKVKMNDYNTFDYPEIQEKLLFYEESGECEDFNLNIYYVDNNIDGFINLYNRQNKKIDITKTKVVTTIQMQEELGLKKGDIMKVSIDGVEKEFVIEDFCENYINNYLYVYKEDISYNSAFVKINDNGLKKSFLEKISEDNNVISYSDLVDEKDVYSSLSSGLGLIVFVVVGASMLLAVIVIYNLTNINVNERIREIATLKVLGYYRIEVCSYIYREIFIMSLMGLVFGGLLGPLLNYFIMNKISSPGLYFPYHVQGINYLYVGLLSLVFIGIVFVIFIPKIKNIKMVESLKSIE